MDIAFDIVDPEGDEARSAIDAYFAEIDRRFRGGFDPVDAGAGHDADGLRPPLGAFVLVRDGDTVVGCGGVQRVDAETAEIKRMWIAPAGRGRGLGRRLLARLEEIACDLGYPRTILDTNDVLAEAIALYASAGYRPIARYNDNPYAHRWFEKVFDEPEG